MRNPLRTIAKHWANRKVRRSPRWPFTRTAFLVKHPTCAACGSAKDLEVHHKLPYHLFPKLELDESNLMTLCETMGVEHHLKVGHTVGGKSSWKLFNPEAEQYAAKMLVDQERAKQTQNV